MTDGIFMGFQPTLLKFLYELRKNNNRDWFQTNKSRYDSEVREPSLAFIRASERPLAKVSPHFFAVAKRVGGSLMRVYRDTRFGKDKTPYKTNVGIQFRHELGRDVHAPGFYIHIEPGECFLGAGIWRPDSTSLGKIRGAIDEEATRWKRARDNQRFRDQFDLAGDSLKTSPRGYEKDHPLIEDLRRTDFIAITRLDEQEVLNPQFLKNAHSTFAASRPFIRFLCDALTVPF